MQGDFSRLLFQPRGAHTGVLMQQGRVQLDADWNEQVGIDAARTARLAADVLGAAVAPLDDPGFGVSVRRGLRFDGAAAFRVEVGAEAFSFPFRDPFTLEASVRPGAQGGTILAKGGLFHAWTFRLAVEGSELVFERHGRSCRAVLPVGDGVRHVVAVFDGRRLALHVDGRALASTSDLRTVDDEVAGGEATASGGEAVDAGRGGEPCHRSWWWSNPVLIGAECRRGAMAGHFQGEMFGVAVWRGALRGDELQRGAYGWLTSGSRRARLVAAWPMDDGGDVLRDVRGRHPARWVGQGPPAWLPIKVWLGAGRLWIDGVVVTNQRPVTIDHQPWVSAPLPSPGPTRDVLVYLEAWERFVVWQQEPGLREVALGGASTTARLATVWRARLLEGGVAAWEDVVTRAADRPRLVADRLASDPSRVGNDLYRVQVACEGLRHRPEGDDLEGTVAAQAADGALTTQVAVDWSPGQLVEVVRPLPAGGGTQRLLARVTSSQPEAPAGLGRALGLTPAWTHGDGAAWIRPIAAFTWSRENAAVVYAVAGRPDGDPAAVVLAEPASVHGHPLANGEWVQLSDDTSELSGAPAQLFEVVQVSDDEQRVVLSPAPPAAALGAHPLLRRWQSTSALGLTPIQDGVPLALERGIRVTFEPGGEPRVGDAWVIPARDALQGVEWPGGPDQPEPQPPLDPPHRLAPLAVLRVHADGLQVAGDLRRIAGALAPGPSGWVVTPGSTAPEGWVPSGLRLEASAAEPTWLPLAPPPLPPQATVTPVAAGGALHAVSDRGVMHRYDPDADTWSPPVDVPPTGPGAATALGDRVAWLGGHGAAARQCWLHDTTSGTWSPGPDLPAALHGASVSAVAEGVLVHFAEGVAHLLGLDGRWRSAPPAPAGTTAIVRRGDGAMSSAPSGAATLEESSAGAWSPAPPLPEPGATLVDGGPEGTWALGRTASWLLPLGASAWKRAADALPESTSAAGVMVNGALHAILRGLDGRISHWLLTKAARLHVHVPTAP